MSESLIWTAVALYLVVSLVIAWCSRTGQRASMADYFLGSRQMGGVVSALSYSATTYSAFMMVGLAGLTYAGGVGAFGLEILYWRITGGHLRAALLGGRAPFRVCYPRRDARASL